MLPFSESLLDHTYQIVFFLVTYVIPMVGLSITYCHLGSVLWRDSQPAHQSLHTRRKVQDKRKVMRCFDTLFFRVCGNSQPSLVVVSQLPSSFRTAPESEV